MHDVKTLQEVIAFYNKGGTPNQWLSKDIRPLSLTPEEQKDLIVFMEALTGELHRKYQPRRNCQINSTTDFPISAW